MASLTEMALLLSIRLNANTKANPIMTKAAPSSNRRPALGTSIPVVATMCRHSGFR